MRAIDIHAHIFPGKIAARASLAIGEFYGMPVKYDGTVSTLVGLGEHAIGTFVVHSVATIPQQVESINDFIAETIRSHPQRLIGFATIHPDYERIDKEIERIIALGLRGIKIHSDFQKFLLDSKEAFGIYEAIEGRLPILLHAGDYRYEYSKARRIAAVKERFPRLEIICAHMGGWSEWEESAPILEGSGVKVDTSSSLYALSPEQARKLIDRYGADNVLFGSDYPMWAPEDEIAQLDRIGLTEEERDKILYANAAKILGL